MLESSFSAGHQFDPDRYDTHSLMATVTYPLFDAGASKASVKAAKASLKQAEESIELSRRAIAQEVESAWLTREEARQRITAAQAARLAQEAGARKLVLNHLSQRYRVREILEETRPIFENVIVARDFDTLPVTARLLVDHLTRSSEPATPNT